MIDTAAKRRSAASVAGVPFVPGVTPDATKPVAWRQQSGWGYSGIAADEPEAAVPRELSGSWAVPSVTGSWAVPSWTGSWDSED